MEGILATCEAHPVGEVTAARLLVLPPWPVDTPGGRYYAELDGDAPVTREGQLIFFAQFLHVGGRWARLIENCPLRYRGNRGSAVVDVVGTAALSILCGHWRYAHINAVRGDVLNPPLLGMGGTVSEDVVRGALKRVPEAEGLAWLGTELRACVEPLLEHGWILDIDSTVKPLHGWDRPRRVVLVRERPARAPVGEAGRRRRDHRPMLPGTKLWTDEGVAPWAGKIAVLGSVHEFLMIKKAATKWTAAPKVRRNLS